MTTQFTENEKKPINIKLCSISFIKMHYSSIKLQDTIYSLSDDQIFKNLVPSIGLDLVNNYFYTLYVVV